MTILQNTWKSCRNKLKKSFSARNKLVQWFPEPPRFALFNTLRKLKTVYLLSCIYKEGKWEEASLLQNYIFNFVKAGPKRKYLKRENTEITLMSGPSVIIGANVSGGLIFTRIDFF